jgi:hypothetical protein
VSSPTFAPPERRSYLLPILIALAILGAGVAIAFHLLPSRSVQASVVHTEAVPIHTEFKSDTIMVGPPASGQDLYIAATVRLENHLPLPIAIDDMTCTLTNGAGEVMDASAASVPDLSAVEQSFPQLKPLLAHPLTREQEIAAGATAEGTLLLHFPLPKSVWDSRKSAILQIALYHQAPLSITIP